MNTFFKWLTQHRENQISPETKKEKYFEELRTLWEVSAKTKIPEAPDTKNEWLKLQRTIENGERKNANVRSKSGWEHFFRPQYAFAAAFVILLMISSVLFYNRYTTNEYETQRKELLSAILPDGTEIKLNSDSRLTYHSGLFNNVREVTLSGEAYFKVRKDNSPFVIKTPIAVVRVVGTQFNVKSREDQFEVAVNRGIVELSSSVGNRDSTITLTNGQFSICREGGFPTPPQKLCFAEYPGWIHGRLTFYQSEVKHICREIERRFDIAIQLPDPELGNVSISGMLEANNIDSLISSLCKLIQKEYRYENETFIIY